MWLHLILACYSCGQNSEDKPFVHDTLYQKNDYLIRQVNYDTGSTKKVIKYYSVDTFSDGAEIHYDRANEIKKWLWFDKNQRYALFGVYYQNGHYQKRKGIPFFTALDLNDSTLAIEMANPPNVNYLFSYKEFVKGKLIRFLLKEPGKTDSTSWVTIPDHQFKNGHDYSICFYILNEKQIMLDSVCQELHP
ncbi:MAG TPA: hypothetical protein PL009_13380 [Flavipsychrobacter sp.]|nr:hypothetical protein [Flavipsychrobacter sp.]